MIGDNLSDKNAQKKANYIFNMPKKIFYLQVRSILKSKKFR